VIEKKSLESLIRDNVALGRQAATGFFALKCRCCNDYKERAGFKFDNGHVGYSCFNCGKAARYEEDSGHISRNMREVLYSFGLTAEQLEEVIGSAFFFKKAESSKITLESLHKVSTVTPTIELPPLSRELGGCLDHLELQEKYVAYLDGRCVDFNRYKFYFSLDPKFKDRVIVPFFRAGRLIYWQARSIHDDEKKRYENPSITRNAVMFNTDELYRHADLPLLVTEGVFDAMMFDGVAMLGSKLNDAKIELLRQSPRRIIFVIDKDDNGRKLAETVLDLGWNITTAPEGAKDVNDSVQKFGKCWTAYQLAQQVPKDRASAQLLISLKCRK
jgi:hypothetical protein